MGLKELAKRQMALKIEDLLPFRGAAAGVPSWVQYIRKAYGMTLEQLAKRSGMSKSQIHQLEKGEAEGRATLASLSKTAHALDCEFVYAFVPRQGLEETLDQQARKKATSILRRSNLQMELEDQAVSDESLQHQLEDLVAEIRNSKKLWDDE